MTRKYPQSELIKLNAWFYVGVAISLTSIPVLFVTGLLGANVGDLFILTLISSMFFIVGYIILGYYLKCPNCGNVLAMKGDQAVHPSSDKLASLDGWPVIAINIIRKKQFRCMHCGVKYHVKSQA